MKFLLTAINAKYIHSNPGVYSLKAYAEREIALSRVGTDEKDQGGRGLMGPGLPEAYPALRDKISVEIAEYTINHQTERILEDIYRRRPDVIGFSCYIWNRDFVWELIHDLHKVLPDVDIWLGGPEVSFDAAWLLEREPEIQGVMKGEGEKTFAGLLTCYGRAGCTVRRRKEQEFWKGLYRLPGVAFRDGQGKIRENETGSPEDLSKIPFLYSDLAGLEHRIIYYESSRGCPFSCSYCLSSRDKFLRFRELELVMKELDFFLEHQVPQVKFVDRTFNCKKDHAMAIWRHILDHDNGVTNFHFEVAADLMDEEELELLGRMRPGLVQLEIGVQSTNPDTIREIHRRMDVERVRQVVSRIRQGQNIHQHLDLIAGLPFEGYESFHRSFNEVYAMGPQQLQLGFLKVLKGSYMQDMAEKYGLVYREKPPYEVLSTRWLPYEEICRLKAVEEMVEIYYNSGQFAHTLEGLTDKLGDPFLLYEQLARYYEEKGLKERNHSRIARYEILHGFIRDLARGDGASQRGTEGGEKWLQGMEDALVFDCYLRENCKSRPEFALNLGPYKDQIRSLAPQARSLGTQVHVEVLRCGEIWMFDYRTRDPLTRNARTSRLGERTGIPD